LIRISKAKKSQSNVIGVAKGTKPRLRYPNAPFKEQQVTINCQSDAEKQIDCLVLWLCLLLLLFLVCTQAREKDNQKMVFCVTKGYKAKAKLPNCSFQGTAGDNKNCQSDAEKQN
jgi:hypothetical protein